MPCPYFTCLIRLVVGTLLTSAVLSAVGAEELTNGLRGPTPVVDSIPAPVVARYEKTDQRQLRHYPEQPPVIPHSIQGYEISLRGNKCLSCHSRRLSVQTGAPMFSISHFMNRDLQVLSDLSPRRYLCTQCHVPQTVAIPPVGNEFIDAADLPSGE